MKPFRLIVFLSALFSLSFSAIAQVPSPYPLTAAENWDEQLGKRVTLTGIAQNLKLGAAIEVERRFLYLKDRASWPEEFLHRRLEVTGTLRTFELPVATQKDGEWSAGVAAPGKAYLLEKAEAKLLKKS